MPRLVLLPGLLQGHRRAAVIGSLAVACLLAWPGLAKAQKGGGGTGTVSAPAPAPQQAPISFAQMAQAVAQQDYTIEQVRRFVRQGQVVAVRERLAVVADGSEMPPFQITFLGVEGELPGSPLHLEWQQTYQRYGPLFHQHGSFRVRDLIRVQQNYTLHDFGPAVRAGRSAVRTVVFPNTTDKSFWVVDVDAATRIPLYWAEFDLQFQLLAEVEAVAFADAVAGPVAVPHTTVLHPDFGSARASLGDPHGLLEPPAVLASYAVSAIETRDDPLNGQQKLVMTYTDGVDQFLVVQVPDTKDVFEDLPNRAGGKGATGHTIARFQDSAMRVLLFWEDGVAFQVTGRGALARLDAVARQLYLQALSTN
ncbi:MAG: hypothetical protein KF830_05865 [Planctomycetes bacterium]|nr:hypothetical protein [Planctomycetota bacterium]